MPLPLIHYFYPSGLSRYLRRDTNANTSWALVTGASDGIGRSLCAELCAMGFNVVLHGRNAKKLELVQNDLLAKHPERQFRIVTADAGSFTEADIRSIVTAVKDLRLTVLVNNVGGTGMLSSNFKHFEDMTMAEMEGLFTVNVLFPFNLTCALLPQLQRQRRALVLTCGSQAHVGTPYLAAYSSTKGALHAWMRALAAEQRAAGSKVDILEVLIGATHTQQLQGDGNLKPGLFMPPSDSMARAILARAGHGHQSVAPYFWHRVQTFALDLLPVKVADGIVEKTVRGSVEATPRAKVT